MGLLGNGWRGVLLLLVGISGTVLFAAKDTGEIGNRVFPQRKKVEELASYQSVKADPLEGIKLLLSDPAPWHCLEDLRQPANAHAVGVKFFKQLSADLKAEWNRRFDSKAKELAARAQTTNDYLALLNEYRYTNTANELLPEYMRLLWDGGEFHAAALYLEAFLDDYRDVSCAHLSFAQYVFESTGLSQKRLALLRGIENCPDAGLPTPFAVATPQMTPELRSAITYSNRTDFLVPYDTVAPLTFCESYAQNNAEEIYLFIDNIATGKGDDRQNRAFRSKRDVEFYTKYYDFQNRLTALAENAVSAHRVALREGGAISRQVVQEQLKALAEKGVAAAPEILQFAELSERAPLLSALGPDAVPYFRKILREGTDEEQETVLFALKESIPDDRLFDDLVVECEEAKPGSMRQYYAFSALEKTRNPTAKGLERFSGLLNSENQGVRQDAVHALAQFPEQMFDRLLTLTDSEDQSIRMISLTGIAKLPGKPQTLPTLRKALHHNDNATVDLTLKLLKEMGPLAEPAVDDLIWILEKPRPDVDDKTRSIRAVDALAAIGPKAERAAARLLKEVSQDDLVAYNLGTALASVKPQSIGDLLHLLKADSPTVQIRVLNALSSFGLAAKAVAPEITPFIASTNSDISNSACQVLVNAEYTPGNAFELLRPAFSRAILGTYLCTTLAGTLPDEALIDAWNKTEDKTGDFLSNYLFILDGKSEPPVFAIPMLKEIAKHKDVSLQRRAVFQLARLGNKAEPALEEILASFGNRDLFEASQHDRVLVAIGEKSIPGLTTLIKSPSINVRQRAASALDQLKGKFPAAKKALLDLKTDEDPSVKQIIFFARFEKGVLSKELLHEMMDYDGFTTRDQIAQWLGGVYPEYAPLVAERLIYHPDPAKQESDLDFARTFFGSIERKMAYRLLGELAFNPKDDTQRQNAYIILRDIRATEGCELY